MGLTIISFLWYFNPNSKNSSMDRAPSKMDFGSVFGDPITLEQFHAAEQEGRIFFRLNYGQWPESEEKKKELVSFAEQRLLLNAELEQYHITVTPEAAARYTKLLLGVKPEDAVPAEKIMEELVKLAREGNVTLDDFDRFARHQAGQEYLVALVGMSGQLITPQEAEVFYRRENEPMETELVSFPVTNFYATTTPAEKDIEDFYTKRQADYRVPDRIQINYVELSFSNYLARAEKQLGTNFNASMSIRSICKRARPRSRTRRASSSAPRPPRPKSRNKCSRLSPGRGRQGRQQLPERSLPRPRRSASIYARRFGGIGQNQESDGKDLRTVRPEKRPERFGHFARESPRPFLIAR